MAQISHIYSCYLYHQFLHVHTKFRPLRDAKKRIAFSSSSSLFSFSKKRSCGGFCRFWAYQFWVIIRYPEQNGHRQLIRILVTDSWVITHLGPCTPFPTHKNLGVSTSFNRSWTIINRVATGMGAHRTTESKRATSSSSCQRSPRVPPAEDLGEAESLVFCSPVVALAKGLLQDAQTEHVQPNSPLKARDNHEH